MTMRVAVLTLAGLAAVCQAHDVISTKITWTREVSRIVYQRCVSCHRDGGSSFSLVNYEEARPWAKAIKEEVLTRRMPPWNAVKGFGEFAHDQGLTQEQIEVIADWVEGGAPEGNPAYLPKRPGAADTAMRRPLGSSFPVRGTRKLAAGSSFAGIQPGALPKGGALQVIATLPDGSVIPLLWVQSFNASYNQPYWFKSPLKFPPGTVIEISPRSATASLLLSPITPRASR